MPISDERIGKSATERATIKARAIAERWQAKTAGAAHVLRDGDLRLTVSEVQAPLRKSYVMLECRAFLERLVDGEWLYIPADPHGHYRFGNPPIRVPDGTTRGEADPATGAVRQLLNVREDPLAAFEAALWETVLSVARRGGFKTVEGGPPRSPFPETMTTDTFYADSSDGAIESTSTGYATARSGGGSPAVRGSQLDVGQYYSGSTYYVFQSFLSFDTSSVPDAATISAVTLSLCGSYGFFVGGYFTANARLYDWGGTLDTADWRSTYSQTLLATHDMSGGWSTSSYNDFSSELAFASNVNKTGSTRLYLVSSRTEGNNTPTGWEAAGALSSEASGSTKDPKLVVTYSTAQDVYPTGIASAEAWGTPTISFPNDLQPTGIPSAEAFGTPMLGMGQVVLPTGIPSEEAFGTPSLLRPIRLLPEANYELSVLDAANKVFVVVEGSSPLVVGSATNTAVPPTYATSPREMVVTIKDGDASKCNTVAAAHLALRQVERYRLNGLPVPLRAGLLIRRGHKVRVVIPRAGVDVTMPVRRVEHDFASNVSLIDVGEFALARDDTGALVELAKALAQLQKETAI